MGKRRRILIIALGIVAILAIAGLLWIYFSRPTTLVLAVDSSTDDLALLTAVGEQLDRERASVRLRVRQAADADAVRAALESKQADLAVMRADRNIPLDARTVAVMRNNVLVLIARGGARIQSPSDLAAKRIGLVGNDVDEAQISAVLSQYNVPATWTTVAIERDRLPAALGPGGLEVLAVAGPMTGKLVADTVAAFGNGTRGATILPIDQVDALTHRFRAFEATEIPAGMFAGNPPKPGESTKTVGFAQYLLAHSDASEPVVTDFTRRLFSARRKLAKEFPAFSDIAAPNTAKDAAVPPHPGAAAYFNDAERSFFDRYGDWVYILAMVASVLGSIAAALSNYLGTAGLRRRGLARRLGNLLKRARAAKDNGSLARIEAEADKILARSMVLIEEGKLPGDALASFSLSFDLVRRAVAERRAALAQRDTKDVETISG